jgi:hypothetical protein
MENSKKVVLTEAQLRVIVEQCVNEAVEEGLGSWLKGAFNKIGGDAGRAAKTAGNNMAQFAQRTAGGVKNAAQRVGQGVRNFGSRIDTAMDNAIDKYGMKMQNGAEAVGNAVKGAGQRVGQYAQSVNQAGQNASNVADIQAAIKTINGLAQRGLIKPFAANMVVGNMQKAIQQIQGGQQ